MKENLNMIEQEYIYIVSNPSIPKKVKVGRTTNLKQRIKQLQTTGVPTPYRYEFVALVDDSVSAEKTAHYALRFYRVARNREFFDVSPEIAIEKITRDLIYFKVNWAYTPQNSTTLKVQENYTRQAKTKIFNVEKELEKVNAELKSLKKTQISLEEKLFNLKAKITPQENILVRVSTSLFDVNNKKIQQRKIQLLEIAELENLMVANSQQIKSKKLDRENLNHDLAYLRDFYKNNLIEEKDQIDMEEENLVKNFHWDRISENDFKHLSDVKIKIKRSIVIIQPGQEGVLLTDENGKEFFVESSEILNFWNY